MPPVELDDTIDGARGAAGVRLGEAPTPEADAVELASISTERLRRAVHRRVFGEVVEPVRIGRYAVLKRVGAGGMGVVYAAYDTDLDRKVALKLLAFDGVDAARESNRRARLVREAKALARLSHPSIVQVFEVGTHEDQLFIAMEYVDGVTLGQWTRATSRGWREIVTMYRDAGRGLAAAHAAGLVHRDFKPDNALVGKDGRLRVLDFGLAGDVGSVDASGDDEVSPENLRNVAAPLTQTGALLGTPAYMAPEQHLGHRADARSDQFGFCVALWEALHGERPFAGETLHALTAAVIEGRMTETAGSRDVPGHLRRVLLRGLASKPDDRWPTMDALIDALDRSLGTAPRRAALGVSALLTIAALGFGGFWITREPRDSARTAELEGEVAHERSRADATELALEQREDGIALAEATVMLERDPTRALAMLGQLRPDAPAWADGRARMIAADAVARGVAEHVIELPEASGTRRLSPRGRWAWSADPVDGRYHVVELATGRSVELAAGLAKPFPDLTFSADESQVVTAQSGAVRLWDLATGSSRELATLAGFASERRFSADGHRVVVIDEGAQTEAIVIDLGSETRRRSLEPRATFLVTPDGKAIVAYSGKVIEWFSLDSDEHRVLDRDVFRGVTLAPDGSVAATPNREGILVTSLRDWTSFVLPVPAGLRGGLLSFDPTSSTLATVTPLGSILVFDLATRSMRRLGEGLPRPYRIALALGGRRIVTLAPDGTGFLHDRGGDTHVLRVEQGIVDLALSEDGATLVTLGAEPRARRWSWPEARGVEVEGGMGRELAISDDGEQIFVANGDTAVRRIDGDVVAEWQTAPTDESLRPPTIAHSSETGMLAIGNSDRVVRFDVDGQARESVPATDVSDLVVVEDGVGLAWREPDGVALWRPGEATARRWPGKWRAAAMAPDAAAFATADTDVITLWDATTGAARWTAKADATWTRIRFDRAGDTIAAVAPGDTIALFAAADGVRHDLAVTHDDYSDVTFDADARVLFALGERAHVIDVVSGAAYEVAVPFGMGTYGARTIDATPDGGRFAFPGWDGIVWRHAFEAPADPTALRDWVAAATDLDATGDR